MSAGDAMLRAIRLTETGGLTFHRGEWPPKTLATLIALEFSEVDPAVLVAGLIQLATHLAISLAAEADTTPEEELARVRRVYLNNGDD